MAPAIAAKANENGRRSPCQTSSARKKIAARWWAERRGGDGIEAVVVGGPVAGGDKFSRPDYRTKAFGPWWSWAEHRKPGSLVGHPCPSAAAASLRCPMNKRGVAVGL